jgi:hypothetical protein
LNLFASSIQISLLLHLARQVGDYVSEG